MCYPSHMLSKFGQIEKRSFWGHLIESTRNAVKKSLPKYVTQKQLYDSYLVEYIIRKEYLNDVDDKGVRALRGYFGPLWGQKIKVALHKFLCISLFEQ